VYETNTKRRCQQATRDAKQAFELKHNKQQNPSTNNDGEATMAERHPWQMKNQWTKPTNNNR
jgi:hypothetical protein